jgi:hypothetical protein
VRVYKLSFSYDLYFYVRTKMNQVNFSKERKQTHETVQISMSLLPIYIGIPRIKIYSCLHQYACIVMLLLQRYPCYLRRCASRSFLRRSCCWCLTHAITSVMKTTHVQSSDCCWCLTHAITSVAKTTHVQVAMVFEQRNKNMAAVVVEVMDCLNMIREGMGWGLTFA